MTCARHSRWVRLTVERSWLPYLYRSRAAPTPPPRRSALSGIVRKRIALDSGAIAFSISVGDASLYFIAMASSLNSAHWVLVCGFVGSGVQAAYWSHSFHARQWHAWRFSRGVTGAAIPRRRDSAAQRVPRGGDFVVIPLGSVSARPFQWCWFQWRWFPQCFPRCGR